MSQTKAQLISDLVQALNFTGTASAPTNGLFLSASNQLKLATASTERLKIDGTEVVVNDTGASVDFRVEGDTNAHLLFVDASADKIGINESSPSHKLVVGGDIGVGFTTPNDAARQISFNVNRGSAGDTLANINWQWNSKFVAQIRGIAGADTTNKDDAHLAFFTSAANNLVERLRILSDGNVGIGTASPFRVFEINNSQPCIRLTNGTNAYDIGTGGFVDGSDSLCIHDQGQGERLRIDSSGRLFLGLTTLQYPKKLNIQGESGSIIHLNNYNTTTYAANTSTAIEFNVNTGNTGNQTGACELRAFKENGTNGDNARALSFYTGVNGGSPTERMRIDSSGHVIATKSIVSENLPGRNLLINGAMDIWQRGTSTSTSGEYQADRFWNSNAATYARDTSVPSDDFVYSAKLTYGSSDMAFGQPVELKAAGEASPFKPGGKCTLSFYAKVSSGIEGAGVIINFRVGKFDSTNQVAFTAASGNASDLNFTATTSWQRFTFTFTVPTPHSSNVIAGVEIYGISKTFFITGVQLELGEIATTFEFRDIGTELALCQRYAHVVDARGSIDNFAPIGNGRFVNGTDAQIFIPLPTTMRQPPTFDGNHTTSSNTFFLNSDGNFGGSACTQLSLNERSFNAVTMTVQSIGNISGQTVGLGTTLYCDGNNDARLMLVAEF